VRGVPRLSLIKSDVGLAFRQGAFTCGVWQVTLGDPIWQVMFHSSEMRFPQEELYRRLSLPSNAKFANSASLLGVGADPGMCGPTFTKSCGWSWL